MVRRCSRSISAAVMTVTELASSFCGVGICVALTEIGGSTTSLRLRGAGANRQRAR